jgi:uncharacterized tellurite resistance protein B-like protein
MDATQNLYYALGQLAYAVAVADGKLQPEEKDRFHKLVMAEAAYDIDFDYANIIFQLLEKDRMPLDVAYQWALHELRLNSHHLNPYLKNKFANVLEQVAKAFPPLGEAEQKLISRFRADVAEL